jgi:hypothetical protein
MFCLNFSNLDSETQQQILAISKATLEQKFKGNLQAYAQKNNCPTNKYSKRKLSETCIILSFNFQYKPYCFSKPKPLIFQRFFYA